MIDKLELKIADILKDLGISANIMGYFYSKYAVELLVKDISLVNSITTRLYPLVAKKFNTTCSRVERAIRHAIEKGWDRGNLKTQNKLFGYTVSSDKGNPTNGEFLCTIADWLNMTSKEGM